MTTQKRNAKIKGIKTLSPDDRVELLEATIKLEDEYRTKE